ncbi:unnamed protein product, partial [Hymenolepis diminuta]
SLSGSHPTNARSSYYQDADFVENVTTIETVLPKMSLPEFQLKWSQRRLLPRFFYKQFNETEPEQQEGVNSAVENNTY